MRDRRNDLLIEVAEDGVEGLALVGTRRRQRIDQLAGLGFRRDGIAARIGEIVGNPVDGVVRGAAKIGDVGRTSPAGDRWRQQRFQKAWWT